MPIYLQHGNLIDYVPPTDTSTEDVVFMGGLVGIPQTFIPAGELGALSVDGVYMFTKKDGVSVSLGDVVKYCGTTKLAQDSNADLTLGVAVADAEADSLGVKVKINSVLPTDGGGGSGGGLEVCTCSGLAFTDGVLYNVRVDGCGMFCPDPDTMNCSQAFLDLTNGYLYGYQKQTRVQLPYPFEADSGDPTTGQYDGYTYILTSKSLKTINGQSLLGSGDITI